MRGCVITVAKVMLTVRKKREVTAVSKGMAGGLSVFEDP